MARFDIVSAINHNRALKVKLQTHVKGTIMLVRKPTPALTAQASALLWVSGSEAMISDNWSEGIEPKTLELDVN